MKPTLRHALPGIAALLLIAILAVLAWLPFDPLEDDAGPLDALVPADADSAWRFDGPSLLRSPFALAAWERPDVRELRARAGVEERVLAPLRRVERAFDEASLGLADAPGLERDLIPAEVVLATRGGDVLAISRISSRARAAELVRKLPEWRAEKLGIRFDGPFILLREESAHPVWIVRHRDALLASTSRPLLEDAWSLAQRGAAGLPSRADWRDALRIRLPAGPRVFGWVRPAAVADRLAPAPAPDDGAAPWWAELLRARDAAPVRVEIDVSGRDALAVTFRSAWTDGLPAALAPLRAPSSPAASSLASRAHEYAVSAETMVSGGIAVNAADVLRALLLSQPPERQVIFEEALGAAGESVDTVARDLASRFEDGAGFVVARLRETDEALRGADAGTVHAIPATLAVLRLKGADAERALLAELDRRAESLFGAKLGTGVEVLSDGARLHTLQRHGLAGQWTLLRPAFAFRGGEFVFSTHDGFLRRALLRTTARGVREPDAAGRTLQADVAAEPLQRFAEDQAWADADRETWRDWAAVRAEQAAKIPADSPLSDADREVYLDEQVRLIRQRRLERDVPDAAERLRERWAWLSKLGGADVSVDVSGGEVEARVRVTLAAPE